MIHSRSRQSDQENLKVADLLRNGPQVTLVKGGVKKTWTRDSFWAELHSVTSYGSPTHAEGILQCKIFLNWYIGATECDNLYTPTVLLGTIACIDVSEEITLEEYQTRRGTIESTDLYQERKTLAPPMFFWTRTANAVTTDCGAVNKVGDNHQWDKYLDFKETEQQQLKSQLPETTAAESGPVVPQQAAVVHDLNTVRRFYDTVWLYLSSDKPDEQRKGKNLCGYLALIITRILVKEPDNVWKYIRKTAAINFAKLTRNDGIISIPPPHGRRCEIIKNELLKGTRDSKILMLHILGSYRYGDTIVKSFLMAGCLLHLQFNGMGVINSLCSLSLATGWSLNMVLLRSFYQTHKLSISLLADIMKTYLSEEGKQGLPCFAWCRLVDDSYHSDLRAEAHKSLVGMWNYAILELDPTNGDVWKAHPFNGTAYDVPEFAKWGKWIKSLIVSVELTAVVPDAEMDNFSQPENKGDDDEYVRYGPQ